MIKKTLGGDRLGSGQRMTQKAHDFGRSNKNLGFTMGTSMAPGVLYPAYLNVALKDDTFDIDLNAFVRTIPTIGPLYGSFKLQVDFFQVPMRLYMALLHNNTIDIARKMNQVYFPMVQLKTKVTRENYENVDEQINPSALMRYLNQSGLGLPDRKPTDMIPIEMARNIWGIPFLAYYDIFKNYYANKQEENAYVITKVTEDSVFLNEAYATDTGGDEFYFGGSQSELFVGSMMTNETVNRITINGAGLKANKIKLSCKFTNGVTFDDTVYMIFGRELGIFIQGEPYENLIIQLDNGLGFDPDYPVRLTVIQDEVVENEDINLVPFPLANIDQMRKYLLTQWDLGSQVVISDENQNYLPYSSVVGVDKNKYPLNGLLVKTYQSDLFNNWLDTEWVNEITETSAIDVSNGSFTIDMLNFKKKLYDHLNRLAISGGTYDDWQEMTYGSKVWGKSEKPIYCGGMSSEVVFDEVVSTAAAQDEVLGTIAGRGTLNNKRKGGHITIKVGEASVIMGIVSLTPRIMYSQGNAWYNTELKTMDDLHKPIFDRIGFQDLMVEQMAWWDAKVSTAELNKGGITSRTSAGKQPAWMNYATDVDKVYGDFARKDGANFMVITRDYEHNSDGEVTDVSTYIDPSKYNYAFAYKQLAAQNFWTFINYKVHARRKMSNTQIPNV